MDNKQHSAFRHIGIVAFVLVLALGMEFLVNRALWSLLKPPPTEDPSSFQTWLNRFGLFFLYLVLTLSVTAVATIARFVSPKRRMPESFFSVMLVVVVAVGVVAAIASAFGSESAATVLIGIQLMLPIWLLLYLVVTRSFVRVVLGVMVWTIPMVIAAIQSYGKQHALFSWDGAMEIASYKNKVLIIAALTSPLFFAPKFRSVAAITPWLMGATSAVLCSLVVSSRPEFAVTLAQQLGYNIETALELTESSIIKTGWIFASGAVAWTVGACFTSEIAYRRILGFALIIVFLSSSTAVWPHLLASGLVGFLLIAACAPRVREETTFRQKLGPSWRHELLGHYALELAKAANGRVTSQGADLLVVADDCQVRFQQWEGQLSRVEIACGSKDGEWARAAVRAFSTDDETSWQSEGHMKAHELAVVQSCLGDDYGEVLTSKNGLAFHFTPGISAPLHHPVPVVEISFSGKIQQDDTLALASLCGRVVELHKKLCNPDEQPAAQGPEAT